MAIRVEYAGDVAVVRPEGVFTAGKDTDELDETLMRLMVEEGKGKVLLDLGETKFIESSAIGVIAAAHGHARDNGLVFCLCGVNERIQRVLDFMKLGAELQIFTDRDEALQQL